MSLAIDGMPLRYTKTRAAQALLIYIIHQPRPVPRERLIDLFYQMSEPKQASANLRSTLSGIKKELGDFLDITRESVGVRLGAPISADSLRFSDQLAFDNKTLSSDVLQAAIDQYHGNFLEGFSLRHAPEFEQWQLIERERLRLLAIDALQQLVYQFQERGDYRKTLHYVDQLLSIEPLLENMHQAKLLLHARLGQRALALRHYQTLGDLFQRELGVTVSAETQALHQRIRQLSITPPHNLPPGRNKFIGRTTELDDLWQIMSQQEQRLVTLLGSGGIGKTRLSLQLARTFMAEAPGKFLDGIYFIPLEHTHSAENIAQQISTAIGLPPAGAQAPQAQLINALRQRELLLILDNFEQLVASSADILSDILAQAPDVKLLVTSRERLNLYEETVFLLDGLALPAVNVALTQADGYAALALFEARAKQQIYNFSPSPADLKAVAQLCRLLEGTPLAIELAAGWIATHSCTNILAQIQQSLDFLATSLRNVPDRHSSLRAVFDHSWALLSAEHQQIYAALSTIATTFDEAAAQHIAGATRQHLVALTNKSLIQIGDDGRYNLHPLLKQFAAEKLCADKKDSVLDRFGRYYATLLNSQFEPAIQTLDIKPIVPDIDNIQAAWQHAIDTYNLDRVGSMCDEMCELYVNRGLLQAGIDSFSSAIVAGVDHPLQFTLLARRAHLQTLIGHIKASFEDIDIALSLPASQRTEDSLASIYVVQTMGLVRLGQFAEAHLSAEKALHHAQMTQDELLIALALNVMGICHKITGNTSEALAAFDQCLAIQRQLNDQLRLAYTLNNLGSLHQNLGNYAEARRYYAEASIIFEQRDNTSSAAVTLSNEGYLALQMGDLAEARQLLTTAADMRRTFGEQRGLAYTLTNLAAVAVAEAAVKTNDATREAATRLQELIPLSLELKLAPLTLEILQLVAQLLLYTDDNAVAKSVIEFVLAHPALSAEIRTLCQQLITKQAWTASEPTVAQSLGEKCIEIQALLTTHLMMPLPINL